MEDKLIANFSNAVDIEFVDVSYSVNIWTPGRLLCPEQKKILKNVSGKFFKNQSCAIIGCSGSGKSSLLNFVSGYKTIGYQGIININGKKRKREAFLKESCYIMQDDHLQPYLTVLESMEISSKLKHCVTKLDVYHQVLIQRILENLNLNKKQHSLTKNLSGGECRRLSIAVELIRNPKVMFFDEPTTGLDMVSANRIVSMLRDLAKCGKTIISTIHQATSSHINLFDLLYVLSPSGQCIYYGHSSKLIDYLSSVGLQCPLHHNPADYILEISSGEYGNFNDTLIQKINNGKSINWCKNIHHQTVDSLEENINKDRNHQKNNSKFCNDLQVLLHRTMIISSRNSEFINIRVFAPFILSFLFGLVYFKIGNNASYTRDNVQLLYFCSTYIIFLSAYSMSIKFPLEFLLMRIEYFNQWYSVHSYFISLTLMDLPIQLLSTGLFCTVLYVMSGQPFEFFRFSMFLLMFILIGLISQATGMLVAIMFKNFVVNSIVISLIVLPVSVFSGILLRIRDTPKIFSWVYDVNILKHSIQGILHSVYGYNREHMKCSEIYCLYQSPLFVLKTYDMSENTFWFSTMYITGLILFLKTCTYIVLKLKLSIN
ncbi:ATP-binding cassette subfamily G member 4-like [Daktulosphaira vitifoliae]|uniref:ATP-binding cassette subfamily G member 4-like n=1 Tax=Daktulosphaira vitifoliae TaxID=58002 RepID=UPI0021A9C806|nr:ATP-binding cassette subfamily G member 4-like [Daktulosphaira vitifoliae]XP_050539806.1 ATP-binding cassette subfamily G member 4-like [Daktulosphaira vitifoliae]XP_050539807.1 ATP-binding cassette subfamily G member 4-like [Daktulosphaira vitifoliae]